MIILLILHRVYFSGFDKITYIKHKAAQKSNCVIFPNVKSQTRIETRIRTIAIKHI